MKAFISQPMKGKTDEQIRKERAAVIAELEQRKHTVIESVFDPAPDNVQLSVWCLGRSIQLMAEADFVVFMKDWLAARGCRIEHEICKQYGIAREYQ